MELNRYIDHTLLKAEATADDITKICHEAIEHDFYSVCINPHFVYLASELLEGKHTKVCTVVGFPLGANTTEIKLEEAKRAIVDGAHEVDMVLNIGELKKGNTKFVAEEISQIAKACHDKNVLLKVIIETALLSQKEKEMACQAVNEGKADFIKTSTGFSTSGATIEDVKFMQENTDENIRVKASGGIRDKETALAMIEAGASRLGASSGVDICKGLKSTSDY
jgi:deoxyribose-phosphate aldolase